MVVVPTDTQGRGGRAEVDDEADLGLWQHHFPSLPFSPAPDSQKTLVGTMGTMILTVHFVFSPVCDSGCVVGPLEPQFPDFLMDVIDATWLRSAVGHSWSPPNLQGHQERRGQLLAGILSTSWLLAK